VVSTGKRVVDYSCLNSE